jgi:hypothetical protein
MIGNKTTHKLSIFWIKSSLSTILPCLPGLAFTENIKNLHLSGSPAPLLPCSPAPLLPLSLIKYLKRGKIVIMFCVVAARKFYRVWQDLNVPVDLFEFVIAIGHILPV